MCPHCRTSTLVDLIAPQSVADPRLRYQVARLVTSQQPGPTMASVQAALGVTGGKVLAATKPGVAAVISDKAAALGVQLETVVAAEARAEAGAFPWRYLLIGGGVLVVGTLVAWLARPAGMAKLWARWNRASGEAPLSGAELAQRGLTSTVLIRCDESLGSGFFVDDSHLLTNAHVICPADEAMQIRTSDGREGIGKAVHVNERLDLALVEVQSLKGTPAVLGDAGTLQVGDSIVVVGAPKGMDFTVTRGVISNMSRIRLGVAYMQTDAAVNPGNSGGPVFDGQGKVVGIVSLKLTDAEGISLFLPVNYAFTGADALLSGHSDSATPGFQKIAAAAEAKDKAEVAQLNATGQRPGLLRVRVLPGPQFEVAVGWANAGMPPLQRFTFHLMQKQELLCTMDADATEWKKLDSSGGESVMSPQVKAWLDRNGFGSDFYVTAMLVDPSSCDLDRVLTDEGLEMELEDADPDAARVRL
jgi:S1-C subfamily serine protease